MRRGQTRYTPVGGTRQVKEAVIEKLHRDNGLVYDTREVLVSCGGKHALYLVFQVLFGRGEEVLVPAPYWVSYPDMLALAGARPRAVPTALANDFKLTPDELEDAIRPETKAIVLNSPSNPAGATYGEGELAALGEVIARHGLIVITDDVYEKIVYDGLRPGHILCVRPDLRERTLVVSSVSKTYAMTGWRIGYTAGPAHVIEAMAKLQGQMTSNPCSIAQAAAAAALSGPQGYVEEMVCDLQRRRNLVVERLNVLPGVHCPRPAGAFYVFPHVGVVLRHGRSLQTGDDLAALLLDEHRVALVGGTGFGYPDHVRISYASSADVLARALDRIAAAVRELCGG
jgi:aspartate aminotransferase